MPCSTPKLIQLLGNIHAEPMLTSSAQPTICAQRRQNFGQPWPACSATASDSPAQNRNRLTMHARCTVHSASV